MRSNHGITRCLLATTFVFLTALGCDLRGPAKRTLDPAIAQKIQEKQAAAAQAPHDVSLRLDVGELQLEAKDFFEAANTFKSVLERKEADVRAHAGLAAAYLSLGYTNASIEHLTDCFKLDLNQPSCILTLAQMMEGDGRPEALAEAKRAYERLLAVAPNHPRAAYAKSMLDQLNARLGPQRATTDNANAETGPASQPAQNDPSAPEAATPQTQPHPPVRNVPGHDHATDQQDVGELNAFGKAIQKAFAARKNQDYAATEAAYREAFALQPDDPMVLAGLAEALFAQPSKEKKDEAIALIERAHASDATDAEVRFVYGHIMYQSGKDLKAALKAWSDLLRDQPEVARQLGVDQQIEDLRQKASQTGP